MKTVTVTYKPEGSAEAEVLKFPFTDAQAAHTFADRQRKRDDVHSVETA